MNWRTKDTIGSNKRQRYNLRSVIPANQPVGRKGQEATEYLNGINEIPAYAGMTSIKKWI